MYNEIYRNFLPFNQYLDNTPKEDREKERKRAFLN